MKTTHHAKEIQGHLTRRQLAERWAMSRETLKRREKARSLPFMKLGASVRYRLTDIEKIEAAAMVQAMPSASADIESAARASGEGACLGN